MKRNLDTDVLIVGGGITGTSVARELSKYKVDVILVEKGADVSCGITKTSHGLIYMGAVEAFFLILKSIMTPRAPIYEPTSPKLALQADGFWESDRIFHELDIPHKHLTTLVTPPINILRLNDGLRSTHGEQNINDRSFTIPYSFPEIKRIKGRLN